MRALYAGVTGIRSHQVRMDVIGNNIANVNTVGFKGSRVTFQDVFSQTMSAGSAATSPQQVGLGAAVASTDLNNAAGSFQLTGRDLDLAIEGAGMFILKGGGSGQRSYTRVGNFDWDAGGYLVNPATGQRVQGWMADSTGVVAGGDASTLRDIQLIKGDVALAQPSTSAILSGNLDAGAANNSTYQTTYTAYDSLGNPQSIVLTFTKQAAPNQWQWAATGPLSSNVTGQGSITFNNDGTLQNPMPATITMSPSGAAPNQQMSVDFTTVTQAYAGSLGSSVLVRKVDGYPMGVLEQIAVEQSGQIVGVFSNGFRRTLAQLGMASFSNPNGLLKVGNTAFQESANSGGPVVGNAGTGGRGRLVAGNLEMSNVDLSLEFTNMITTQRGFQANTRIITAADEMLQDVVNLRR